MAVKVNKEFIQSYIQIRLSFFFFAEREQKQPHNFKPTQAAQPSKVVQLL